MTTLQEALQHAARLGLARVDAQILLLHTMGQPAHARAWLLTHDTDTLNPTQLTNWEALLARRLAGEPVAYLTGVKAFYGLDLHITPHVLDPRPDTEVLVDWALALLQDMLAQPEACGAPERHAPARPRVLDLGTGSGAIALAIAHMQPAAQVTGVDASPDALAVARSNAQRLGLAVSFIESDWLANMPADARFELIVSNPPYIRSDDPHLPALRHEPLQALVSGPDGLNDIRHIAQAAKKHLAPEGWLLFEHGWDQADAVQAILRQAGFDQVQSRQDLGGQWRCTGGQLHTPGAA